MRINIYESLNLDLSIERNKIIQEIYDYMRLNNYVQAACKVCIHMHEQLPEWVKTKEDFIEFFSNKYNHIKTAGVELIKHIREYLGITVIFEGEYLIEDFNTQRLVYTTYLNYLNIFETAKRFNISYTETKIIISKFEHKSSGEYLMCDIRNFLRKNYPDMEIKICNPLGRYLSQNQDITTKDQLRKIIYKDESYIRGFGEKAQNTMKEYFFTE